MWADCVVGNESFRARAANLGGGGLFLADVATLAAGQELLVRFRPAKHLPIIRCRAIVRYVLAGKGAAVEFLDIATNDRMQLLHLIRQKTGDRRLTPRAPLATQVQCDENMSLAFSRDISTAGMFVETISPPPLGSVITVRFNLDNKDQVVTARARVVYHVEKMGMGIQFTDLQPRDTEAIREYVTGGRRAA